MKAHLTDYTKDGKYITFRAESALKRLRNINCDINPIEYQSELLFAGDGLIRDPYADWATDEYKDKWVCCIKNDKYTNYAEIVSREFYKTNSKYSEGSGTSITPDFEEGTYYRLYFDDPALENHHASCDNIGAFELAHVYTFELYLKENTIPDALLLELSLATVCRKDKYISGLDDLWRPKIMFYKYTTPGFVTFENLSENRYSVAEETPDLFEFGYLKVGAAYELPKSPKLEATINIIDAYNSFDNGVYTSIDINDFITDYVSKGPVDTNGYQKWTMKVLISAGFLSTAAPNDGIEFYRVKIKAEGLDTLQNQITDSAQISSNAQTSITLNTSAHYPVDNAICEGDEFIISDTYENVLDDIFAAQSDYELDSDLTTNNIIVKSDLTYTPISTFLAKACDLENAIFYDMSDELTNKVVIRKTLESTGLTLTAADIVNFHNGGYEISRESENIKT